jgi:hypothetical protein
MRIITALRELTDSLEKINNNAEQHDEVQEQLEEIRRRLEEEGVPEDGADERLAELEGQVDELAAQVEGLSGLDSRVDELAAQVEELAQQGTRRPSPDFDEIHLGDDTHRQTQHPNQCGIRFTMHENVEGFSVRVSARTREISEVLLKEPHGGDVIEQVELGRTLPGDWIYIDSPLTEGETYELVAHNGEHRFPRGENREMDYPVEVDVLTLECGIYSDGGAESQSRRYCFDRFQPGQDFSGRERSTGLLDDVPNDAEVVYADAEFGTDGDVAAKLQDYVDDLDEINHCVVLPDEEMTWETHVQVPRSAEFFGLVGEGRGPQAIIRRFISQPLTIGSTSDGVRAAVVRNVTFDIDGEDENGYNIDSGFLEVFAQRWFVVEDCHRKGVRQRYQRFEDGIPSYLSPRGPYDDANGVDWYHVGNAYGFHGGITTPDGVGIVRNCRTDGGINNPVADYRSTHPGEGVGFSAERNRGTIYWRENVAHGAVGNTFYMHGPNSDESTNIVLLDEIYNGSRSSIRLGDGDEAHGCYVQFDQMRERYSASGVWFNHGEPIADQIEIEAPDGNHELVRDTSDGGTLTNSYVHAGPNNEHFSLRSNAPTVIEDTVFVDESNQKSSSADGALHFNHRDAVLRNVTIDVSNTPRDPISGHEPEMIDCEIIE